MKVGDVVYVTKYALSNGIIRGRVDDVHTVAGSPALIRCGFNRWQSFLAGKEVVADLADAVKIAEAMRDKKLKSLKDQVKKLEKRDMTKVDDQT